MSYRLVWERKFCGRPGKWNGESCTKLYLTGTTSVVSRTQIFKNFKWQLKTGNSTEARDLSDLYFTDMGVLQEVAYETGVGISRFNFDANADTVNIKLR